MENAPRAHRPGDLVAEKYLLVRMLEVGGMGAVWVAHHLALDVQVALKFLLPDKASPAAAERLLQEAQVAARVRHPAIVQILDVGLSVEGETYLVMELLDGEPLADVLARSRRLDPSTAIRVLLPVAAALDALRRHGIIHRDIEPENIFLACDDADRWQPKLVDFGLARSTHADARRITAPGAVMGTPAYMSRERLLGGDVDHQEDVYALSVVLYQALTGEVPFPGDDPLTLFSALTASCPRTTLDHGVGDGALWAIVERGLAPRGERWGSALDLGRALAGWLWDHGIADDITGMSLRPTWIVDDDGRRLAPPGASKMRTLRLGARRPSSGCASGPGDLQAGSGRISLSPTLPEVAPPSARPRALPPARGRASGERSQRRALVVLAVLLTVVAIVSWARLLVRDSSAVREAAAADVPPGAPAPPGPESIGALIVEAPGAAATLPPETGALREAFTRRERSSPHPAPPRAPAPGHAPQPAPSEAGSVQVSFENPYR